MKKIVLVGVFILLVILIIGSIYFLYNKRVDKKISKVSLAISTSASISSQDDWGGGASSNNIDSTSSPGDIKISNLSFGPIDLSGKTITVNYNDTNKNKPIDGNEDSYWDVQNISKTSDAPTWTIDLGQDYPITKIKVLANFETSGCCFMSAFYKTSSDGATFNQQGASNDISQSPIKLWRDSGSISTTARYVQYVYGWSTPGDDTANLYVYEVQILSGGPATATYTSGDMQINGGDNFWGWETFTSTYSSDPPNTDVKFRFRTSTNHTGWTDWSAYQTPASGAPLNISSLVTSRDEGSGDDNSKDAANFTYYKYLQVETTLTSTDGVANPTVSDYSIGYHTNVAPSKPVGGTAVIGQ